MEKFIEQAKSNVYSRYGLAVSQYLYGRNKSYDDFGSLKNALLMAITHGLNHFRMRTSDKPAPNSELKFSNISFDELQRNTALISGQLAKKGIYLFPSVMTTDKTVINTYNAFIEMLKLLENQNYSIQCKITKSIQPMVNKTNRGKKSQSAPTESFAVCVCSAITTVTPLKPSFYINPNVCCIPDLPFEQMLDFIELFDRIQKSELGNDLMIAKISDNEYKRPKIHNGNFPGAPPFANVLGSVGVLAAIGDWTNRAENITWAKTTLDNIKNPDGGICFNVFSYNMSEYRSEHYSHHIVQLASNGSLKHLLSDLVYKSIFYNEEVNRTPLWESPQKQLFLTMLSRFLQQLSQPSFSDFLSFRTEYPEIIKTLLETYFMENQKISKSIVESACTLGRWLNKSAYNAAKQSVDDKKYSNEELRARIEKEKHKILIEFESAILNSKDPQDMLFRISSRAGRLIVGDMPAEAKEYLQATASGEIDIKTAAHLLIAFLRLRSDISLDSQKKQTPSNDFTPEEQTIDKLTNI